jgi:hypothetical protein
MRFGSDGDHPQFLPALGQVLNVGQPNADTIYRTAKITPGGTFRLREWRGSMRIAVIAEADPRPTQVPGQLAPNLGPARPIHEINKLRWMNTDVLTLCSAPSGPGATKAPSGDSIQLPTCC